MTDRLYIYAAIDAERARQDEKHGERSIASPQLGMETAYLILAEEVGEVARTLLDGGQFAQLREELIQVAACAVGWLEAME